MDIATLSHRKRLVYGAAILAVGLAAACDGVLPAAKTSSAHTDHRNGFAAASSVELQGANAAFSIPADTLSQDWTFRAAPTADAQVVLAPGSKTVSSVLDVSLVDAQHQPVEGQLPKPITLTFTLTWPILDGAGEAATEAQLALIIQSKPPAIGTTKIPWKALTKSFPTPTQVIVSFSTQEAKLVANTLIAIAILSEQDSIDFPESSQAPGVDPSTIDVPPPGPTSAGPASPSNPTTSPSTCAALTGGASCAPMPTFPMPAPAPTFPMPGPAPTFPMPGPAPAFPMPGPAPTFPMPGPAPAFPMPGPAPAFPMPGPAPAFPMISPPG